jgi:hypothetical protein
MSVKPPRFTAPAARAAIRPQLLLHPPALIALAGETQLNLALMRLVDVPFLGGLGMALVQLAA